MIPVQPPVLPMLSKRIAELPEGDGWIFEPKWDGFRALIFRDGDELTIQSRDGKPLNRYFPEVVEALKAALPERCVLDGEIVLVRGSSLDFEVLQQRIHPAATRVKRLAAEIPASVVYFDLLCDGDRDLRGAPFRERRALLEARLGNAKPPIHLTPATTDRALGGECFKRFEGAGLDGVMAKPAAGLYVPNKRVMFMVKHERECDCVVAGFRWRDAREDREDRRRLAAARPLRRRRQAATRRRSPPASRPPSGSSWSSCWPALSKCENALADHPWQGSGPTAQELDAEGHRVPGVKSRWRPGEADLSWEPLRAELVVEVAYEHMQGSRFRHTAHFRRWRPDKSPRACTYEQLEIVAPHELAAIFAAGR